MKTTKEKPATFTADKYKISILWGEAPEDDAKPKTYSFKTKSELDAFILGINEMDGWQGWEIVSQEGRNLREVLAKVDGGEG